MSTYIRFTSASIFVCLLLVLTERVTAQTSSEYLLHSHREESTGINQNQPKPDYNQTLSVKNADQIYNLTGNETYNLNVININTTSLGLESGKALNLTRNETYNLNVANLNETLSELESEKVFNFTETQTHNVTHHHSLLNDTNYNETFQTEESFNFSGNETYNGTHFQSHLSVTLFNETLPDLDFENVYNFTEIDEFNATYNGTSTFTSFDNLTTTTTEAVDEDYSYYWVEPKIVTDHIDFILLRLKHISMRASSNITELLELQQEEFEINPEYRWGWGHAAQKFNSTLRERIYNMSAPDSIVRQVPDEYHIAVMAYTGWIYWTFNRDTREVCSGKHIDSYKWKSYFKLLQLAIATLGTQEEKWRDDRRFLYRGVYASYDLKVGQIVAFQHFVSTSVRLKIAENFAGKSLFEFQGLFNGTAMAVWDHSYYKSEDEYLFSPLQAFRVASIHVGYYYTRYVLAKHEMPVLCDLKTTRSKIGRRSNITTSFLRAHSGTEFHGNYALKMKFLMLFLHIVNSLIT